MSEYDSPLKATVASTVSGSPEFVGEVSARHLRAKHADRSVPALRELVSRPSMEEIIRKVKAELGKAEELLKNLNIYCCHKYSGATLKEIGERFGTSDAAVCQTSRRLLLKAGADQQIKHKLERVDALLKDVNS
jgi:DNA-directed RNA polymerase specialized sigma subunit